MNKHFFCLKQVFITQNYQFEKTKTKFQNVSKAQKNNSKFNVDKFSCFFFSVLPNFNHVVNNVFTYFSEMQ